MQPYSRISLAELAIIDPVAAYGRLRGIQATPVIMNSVASFSSLTLGQNPVKAALDQTISKRTWIEGIDFDLQLPNAFVGNIFFPQAMAMLKQNPGISVRTTVMSGPRYLVADTYTPIENYVAILRDDWVAGWQIQKFQQIQTEFLLTALPFNDPTNTPPYTVTLTYRGWQFMDGQCDDISCEWATEQLMAAGVITQRDLLGAPPGCGR